MEKILEAKNISKQYPGVVALDDVSFNVYKGKVNVLVGENGAGKSTLMKILSGVERQSSGQIYLNNKKLDIFSTNDAEKNSIGIIHQELNLFPNLTVHENIFMGHEMLDRYKTIDTKKQIKITNELLLKLNQDIDAKTLVESLRIGQQQIIEIAKALAKKTKILIMDEPSSALSKKEVSVLFNVIEELKKQEVTIIYISHKLEEIMQIGDVITILRDSKFICEELINKIDIPWITENMVGMKSFEAVNTQKVKKGPKIIELKSISLKKKESEEYILDDVNFKYSSSYDPTTVSIFETDSNVPTKYLLKKRVRALSGELKEQLVTFTTATKYDKIVLGNPNVIEIISCTDSDGNSWYEVMSLGQDTIVDQMENNSTNSPDLQAYSGDTPYLMKLRRTPRRFVTYLRDDNRMEIRFGSGISDNPDEELKAIIKLKLNKGL